jgi:flagellar FliL protein
MAGTPEPKEAEGATAAPEPAPRRRRPLLLIGGIGLVVVAGLGAGAWFLAPRLLGVAKPGAAAAAKPAPKVQATVPLGSVVVNVAGETRRYVKVAVDLGLEDGKATQDVEAKKPQILDLLITVLSAKDVETLSAPEGREALKDEMLAGIREQVGLPKVIRVFFTEFLIQ